MLILILINAEIFGYEGAWDNIKSNQAVSEQEISQPTIKLNPRKMSHRLLLNLIGSPQSITQKMTNLNPRPFIFDPNIFRTHGHTPHR